LRRNSPRKTRRFPPCQQRPREAEWETASQPDKGHGRREHRTLQSTTALNRFLEQQLGWTGVKQAFRVTRRRTTRDRETGHVKTTTDVAYGITSLARDQADAEKLLALNRGHWGIENRLHWVRDMVFAEDHCRIRTGQGPQQLATARNAAIAVCRVNNHPEIAAARREFAWNPSRLFAILGFMKE
jgi:predicted transposase YbfD/YdcC